jgi:hypothetical protein
MRCPRRTSYFLVVPILGMVAALASGCVTQSVHPLYDERTLVFDERLLGSWGDDDAVWSFTADGAGGYELLHSDPDGTIVAEAHLVRIDGSTFLDIYAPDLLADGSELREVLVLPLHTIFRVDELDDRLVTSSLGWNWTEDYLEDNPAEIAHTLVDDRVVLTDGTRALQRFFAAHAEDSEAWEEAVVMQRQPSEVR